MNKLTLFSKKHSPEILIALGIAGMVTTTIMAVKATPKALILIKEKKEEKDSEKLAPMETVKTTWKCYIPASVTCVLSIFCLIGAGSVHSRRNAALATAYAISGSALKEYQTKVVDTIGEKKEREIRDAIAKDKLDKNPVRDREVFVTDKGDTLCYDVISGRYFKSDIDRLKKAVNELNRRMMDEMYIPLNDFYYEIGLRNTSMGDDPGWNINDGLIDLYFTSQIAEDGRPCLVINYQIAPRYDYYKR